jgi:carbamoyl-phosphate synthase small subunit
MRLVLQDGQIFHGESFGALKEVQGEVVFNTGMSGYVETLTVPTPRQLRCADGPLRGGQDSSARIGCLPLLNTSKSSREC